jgi:hypothetical protein
VLLSALVASARITAVPEDERVLLSGPVELGSVTHFEQLRLDITRAQRRVGLSIGAAKAGNNRSGFSWSLTCLGTVPVTRASQPPAARARRHRFADIRDTRKYFATSRSLAPGYLILPAYRPYVPGDQTQ